MKTAWTKAATVILSGNLLVLAACGGEKKEVRQEEAVQAEPDSTLAVLRETDKALILTLNTGEKRVEIEYRLRGGGNPSLTERFLRAWTAISEEDAWKQFAKLSKKNPQSPLGFAGQTHVYTRWKMYDKALENLTKAKALAGDKDPLVARVAGDFHFAQEQYDQAKAEYDKVLAVDPGNLGVTIKLGQLYAKQDQLADAVAAYRAALEKSPGVFVLHVELGDLLVKTGQHDEALAAFAGAEKLNGNDHPLQVRLGKLLLAKGDYAGSVEHLERAVSLQPTDIDTLRLLAGKYRERGDAQNEMSAITRILEIDRLKLDLHLRLGDLALAATQTSRARAAYTAALALDERNAKAFVGLARISKFDKKMRDAVKYYLDALNADSQLADARREYNAIKGIFFIAEPVTGKDVQQIYDRLVQRVLKVYQDRLKEKPNLKGEIEVHFDVLPSGKVSALEFPKNTLNDEIVDVCLFGNALEAQFPPTEKGRGATMTFPFQVR